MPTLFIWGDQDDTVGRAAAEGTGEFIAAPYQSVALPGVGHYAADQVPEQVNAPLQAHLARHIRRNAAEVVPFDPCLADLTGTNAGRPCYPGAAQRR
jgi:hypothetical protein